MAGDGFKNYFTFAYQYKYGKGLHFDGFMYPYGDLTIYADSQIFIVWIFQGLRSIGIDSEPYLLGILNSLPLFSFIVAGLFLVGIFQYYKVPYPFALLFAIVCIALSPQIFRIQSHYALAYAYFIPAIWWLNLKMERHEKQAYKWLIVSCVLVFTHGFIHPYLLFIASIFLLSLWVCKVLVFRKISLLVLIQGVIPILGFLLIMHGIDVIVDRPKNPYGLLVHKSEISDLFPFYGWFYDLLGSVLNLRSKYHEGYAYVGMLILIVPLLLTIKQAFKNRDVVQDKILIGNSLWSYFLAGLLCLAVGLGLHILLTGGLILDILPMIKQIRALGRVSWIYYYIMFAFLCIVFYQLYDSLESKPLKWFILILVIIMWGSDIYNFHSSLNKGIKTYKSKDLLNTSTLIKDILTDKNIAAANFQAVFVLPSSSEGTEKISFSDDWSSKMNAIPFSFQTGIPLTSIVMSRSSISNSLNIMQLSSSQYIEKAICSDFKNKKPLLMIMPNDRLELFSDIVERATLIETTNDFSLFEISVVALQKTKKIKAEIYTRIESNIDENGVFLDYENEEAEGLLSSGSKMINGEEKVFEIPLNIQDSVDFGLSLWYEILDDKSNVPHFNLEIFDINMKRTSVYTFRDWDMKRVEVMDNWIRLKKSYKFSSADKYVRLSAFGKFLYLDRVLLKPDEMEFQAVTRDSSFVQWNHFIGQKEL